MKVFERKEGCPAALCGIYQEVASKMGIFCELVYCRGEDVFWDEEDENFMDSTMNSPMLLLRSKDSAG